MAAPGLVLDDLRRTFGEVVALDGLTFSLPPGVLFGFVGRNGAGKTTTMRIVCGLLAPDAGSVTWRGEPIDARVRQRIGYMPEERGLYPKMRARDQLEYFGVLHGLTHARGALGGDRVARAARSRRSRRLAGRAAVAGQPAAGAARGGARARARSSSCSTSRSPASIRSSVTC